MACFHAAAAAAAAATAGRKAVGKGASWESLSNRQSGAMTEGWGRMRPSFALLQAHQAAVIGHCSCLVATFIPASNSRRNWRRAVLSDPTKLTLMFPMLGFCEPLPVPDSGCWLVVDRGLGWQHPASFGNLFRSAAAVGRLQPIICCIP